MASLDSIFKAYDVRGVVPDQFDASLAHDIGAAFARFAAPDGGIVLVARDMRPSGVELVRAFTEGVTEQAPLRDWFERASMDDIAVMLSTPDGVAKIDAQIGERQRRELERAASAASQEAVPPDPDRPRPGPTALRQHRPGSRRHRPES